MIELRLTCDPEIDPDHENTGLVFEWEQVHSWEKPLVDVTVTFRMKEDHAEMLRASLSSEYRGSAEREAAND